MNPSQLMLVLLVGAGCGVTASAGTELSDAGLSDAELPGAELLEFLGGWEGEDGEWQEFFDSLPVIRETTSPGDGSDDMDEQIEQENGQ